MPRCLAMFVAMSFISGCGSHANTSHTENIFGNDDRVAVTTTMYPWNTIGKMAGIGCTATLVGPALVLTAAHCVIDQTTGRVRSDLTTFRANYIAGHFENEATIMGVTVGSTAVPTPTRADWAFLTLKEPLGDTVGWLEIKSTTTETFPDVMTVVGYSGDFLAGEIAGAHNLCRTKARDHDRGLIEHDCDTTRGASGGPAVKYYGSMLLVVGLNVAERREGNASMHIDEFDSSRANILIPSAELATKAMAF